MTIALVWAQSADRCIGRHGSLPWHLPEDLARFRQLTSGHPVIMGRVTWESLPERFRPLPGRDNIVLTRGGGPVGDGALVVPDAAGALAAVGDRDAWVIGGARVYEAFLPLTDRLEVTQVDVVVHGDTPAPALGPGWRVTQRRPEQGWAVSSSGLRYRFLTMRRADSGVPHRGALGYGASATGRRDVPTQARGPER